MKKALIKFKVDDFEGTFGKPYSLQKAMNWVAKLNKHSKRVVYWYEVIKHD